MIDQQFNNLGMTFSRCKDQGRVTGPHPAISVRTVREKRFGFDKIPNRDGGKKKNGLATDLGSLFFRGIAGTRCNENRDEYKKHQSSFFKITNYGCRVKRVKKMDHEFLSWIFLTGIFSKGASMGIHRLTSARLTK
jgi:hypothetical protein